jgi:hypothetical protein
VSHKKEYLVRDFTNAILEQEKKLAKNVVVAMGFLGNQVACFNPENVRMVFDEYERHFEETARDDDKVIVVGFERSIEVYDLEVSERDD